MASLVTTDLPSSTPVFDVLTGFLKTQLLSVGVDLGIFDVLAGRQKLTADQIADKLKLKADLLVRFLRALVGINLLELHDGTVFSNTPASDVYLVSFSPRSIIGAIRFMKEVEGESYSYLPDAIRGDYKRQQAEHARRHGHEHGHGEHGHGIEHTATQGHGGEGHQHGDACKPQGEETKDFGEVLNKDPGLAQVFSEGMLALGRADMDCLRCVDFTGVRKAVDLGGSLGQQARELRRLHPSVETIIVADLKQVVQIGSNMKENKDANIEYQTVNFITDELPKADAYILGHVLHGNEDHIVDLVNKVHDALNDGGLLVLLEGVLHEDRVGPTSTLLLDMVMLARDAGRERTPGDYRFLLESHGFRDVNAQFVNGAQNFDVITARKA